MAKSKQFKFSGIANATIQDGYTVLVIIDGLATVTTEAEAELAERNGGQPVVANVVERKSTAKKRGDK